MYLMSNFNRTMYLIPLTMKTLYTLFVNKHLVYLLLSDTEEVSSDTCLKNNSYIHKLT